MTILSNIHFLFGGSFYVIGEIILYLRFYLHFSSLLIRFHIDIAISSCSELGHKILDHQRYTADVKFRLGSKIDLIDLNSSFFIICYIFSRNRNMSFFNIESFDFFSVKEIFFVGNGKEKPLFSSTLVFFCHAIAWS